MDQKEDKGPWHREALFILGLIALLFGFFWLDRHRQRRDEGDK